MRDRHAAWRGLRWTLRRQVLAPGETFAAYGEVVWSRRRAEAVLRTEIVNACLEIADQCGEPPLDQQG